MPDEVKFNQKLGIIEVRSWGEVVKSDLEQSMSRMFAINQETGVTRVLVDTTGQKGAPRTLDLFTFGEKLASQAKEYQLAIVASSDNKEDQTFLETVVTNRGSTLRLFESKDKALIWLLKD